MTYIVKYKVSDFVGSPNIGPSKISGTAAVLGPVAISATGTVGSIVTINPSVITGIITNMTSTEELNVGSIITATAVAGQGQLQDPIRGGTCVVTNINNSTSVNFTYNGPGDVFGPIAGNIINIQRINNIFTSSETLSSGTLTNSKFFQLQYKLIVSTDPNISNFVYFINNQKDCILEYDSYSGINEVRLPTPPLNQTITIILKNNVGTGSGTKNLSISTPNGIYLNGQDAFTTPAFTIPSATTNDFNVNTGFKISTLTFQNINSTNWITI